LIGCWDGLSGRFTIVGAGIDADSSYRRLGGLLIADGYRIISSYSTYVKSFTSLEIGASSR